MNSTPIHTISPTFNVKDYIDATTDAAKRTRTITIVLVVASVLVAIGWYNSLVWSWPIDRIRRAYNPDDPSVHRALNTDDNPQLRSASALFEASDFIDPLSLARKLADDQDPQFAGKKDLQLPDKRDPLSEYLYGRLAIPTKQLMAEYVITHKPTEQFLQALANDLNSKLLKEQSLFDKQRFKHVALTERTDQLLKQLYDKDLVLKQPADNSKLIRLNRQLLEDAYPLEITKIYDKYPAPADKLREQLQQSGVRAYVENVRLVRAPFFGIAFDVNDLGLIGGVGLITILLLLRFSLSREIKNLKVSFREAVRHKQLPSLYYALAMRQVFTVPDMKGEKRNRALAISPKIICVLPAIIFSLGVTYDYYTVFSDRWQFIYKEVRPLLYIEFAWLVLIWFLSIRCWERQSHIDSIWQRYWKRIKGMRTSVIMLDEDLVEEFGSDDAVNSALKKLRAESSGAKHAPTTH